MIKTVKYISKSPSFPSNFVTLSHHKNTSYWKKHENTNDYILGELTKSNYDMSAYYSDFFGKLVKGRKKKKGTVKIYEWKEFLLFLFSVYQNASKQKIIPRARARAIRVFIEDFQFNIKRLTKLDKEFNLKSKADKIFYLKKENELYLLGFLIDKKLFTTFSHIRNHLVTRYLDQFIRPNATSPTRNRSLFINNFEDYFLFFLYKKWGVEIKNKPKSKKQITIGADPEFLIYGKYKKNPKLADYKNLKHAGNIIISHHSYDELGLDGCTDLGELRPQPSTSPHTLTKNIKGLFNKFYTEYGDKYFIETGGGCEHSIGGHIHIGHEFFKNYTNAQIKPLLQLLDAFLYYPIKLNMYGAVREWRDYNELNVDINYDSGECKIDEDPEKIIQTIKRVKPLKSQQFNSFDLKSMQRSQPHGLEYRSLPSFIGDFMFTKLVLKLAKGIAEKYIELRTQGIEFKYNDPPQKEDYLIFLKEKEVKQLFEYLYGKKRDLFLKNTLSNWKVIKQYFINITDNLGFFNYLTPNPNSSSVQPEIETQLTKLFRSTLLGINNSLNVYLLASNHYYRSANFRRLTHPTFITTRHINFSTLDEGEIQNFMKIPNKNTIYIGIPYTWRDCEYINKKQIFQIIIESINIFQLYNGKRNSFKMGQTINDLKKIPVYNDCLLSQIAEEIKEYSKLFKKEKPKKATTISERRRYREREESRTVTADSNSIENMIERAIPTFLTDNHEDESE